MKLWETFLALIYNFLAKLIVAQKKILAFEDFISKAYNVFDDNSLSEIKNYTQKQQHAQGLFKDKAGNPDLYYSLFGYFISASLQLENTLIKLKNAVKNNHPSTQNDAVHVFCAAILYAQLIGKNKRQKNNAIEILNKLNPGESGYIWFLGLVSLYYFQDYFSIKKYLKKFQSQIDTSKEEIPCTLIAAEIILKHINKKPTQALVDQLIKYYRPSGGFAALQKSPIDDLLSTAVCLFALQFAGTDLRIIKPDTLAFIESLYLNGGFVATPLDTQPDIEYTFYGLLAMASLENSSKT